MSSRAALAQRAHYYSTYCIHEQHDQCKRSCKVCGAPCQCSCHGAEQNPSAASEALVGAGVGGPPTEEP